MIENLQTKHRRCHCRLRTIGLSLICGLMVVSSGCVESAPAIDSAVQSAHRGRLLLDEEPAGAQSVLAVREKFASSKDESEDTASEDTAKDVPQDVVVVGKIGGMPNPWTESEPDFPFKKDSATLFLVDTETTAKFGAKGHSLEEHVDCPFCARAAAENIGAIAVVNFVGKSGQVVPISAQPLLELNPLATVVVRGKARLVGGEMLVIDADGVYVRKQPID